MLARRNRGLRAVQRGLEWADEDGDLADRRLFVLNGQGLIQLMKLACYGPECDPPFVFILCGRLVNPDAIGLSVLADLENVRGRNANAAGGKAIFHLF